MNRADEEAITAKVRSLEGMPLDVLRQEWRRLYGHPPPIRSVDLLSRWLAWKIQAEAFGGFDAETAKALFHKSASLAAPRLNPGDRLEREWRGRKIIVDVVQAGFSWRGEVYASLSALARAITGTRWNGHVFFGLRK